ncbi:MAG TPA: adenylate/guanylate cyclase domain-containing protein [Rhodoferax sp.]|nr:adenylate/guanylate cyclase domain-containing protein [Rhodoferax sp.]
MPALRHRWLAVASASLTAALATLIAPLLPWMAAMDLFVFDAWHRLAGQRTEAMHTAIVAIDDTSLARFHDTPLAFWQPQFGAAIATLRQAGVKVIGIDLIQASSAEAWLNVLGAGDTPAGRSYEAPYRAALADGQVVLAGARAGQPGEADLMPPAEHIALLPGGADDIGLVTLEADGDGFVRRLAPVLASNSPSLAFAARLVLAAQPERQFASAALTIPFAGPPGTVPRVSLATLTDPDALKQPQVQALRDRIVIIAADATQLQDLQLTPYARALPGLPPQLMSGGEVHAQVVEAWLGQRTIAVPAAWQGPLLAAALGLLLGAVALRSTPILLASLAALLAVASLLLSAALFGHDVWLAPTPLLLGLASAWTVGLGNRAGREARERAHLRRLFSRYVSDEVAELAVRDALPDTDGAAADVTVLFLDIRDFTSISEKLSSREVFELLNAWLPQACDPILAAHGNVDKFIGDAVMAVFGSPLPLPDHAQRAIDAARTVALAADEFAVWVATRFADRKLPPFAIGIGLHSGPVVVGNLGTAGRIEFTAIGDTVNVASRLESASKTLGWRIVASAATVQAAGSGLRLGASQSVSLKGKASAIEVFEIPYHPET